MSLDFTIEKRGDHIVLQYNDGGCRPATEPEIELAAERDRYYTQFMLLRNWLMDLVGTASTLPSAQRTVERVVAEAVATNREKP